VRVDSLVVGGGVVGLAIARALQGAGREVVLVERHRHLGSETSSRNSEVIHAGLYYPTHSLKARLCVAGKIKLYQFADAHGVPVRKLGKLVVATSEIEIAALRGLMDQARRNDVSDITLLGPREAQVLEPALRCAAACLSPSSGMIDSDALLRTLEAQFLDNGGTLALQTQVLSLHTLDGSGMRAKMESSAGEQSEIEASLVVNAAGHGAAKLAATLDYPTDYKPPPVYLAKGHYYLLSGPAPFSRLIYPLPTSDGLGIHFSMDEAGQARFGPDVDWVETLDYSFDDPDGLRRQRFITNIQRYWPDLPTAALSEGYTGIRPKLQRPGGAAQDFAVHGPEQHGVQGLISLFGIDSPGLTSSLAIAELVASMARQS
jgi:L-2-hydroxyglutarate oxidase LhgO